MHCMRWSAATILATTMVLGVGAFARAQGTGMGGGGGTGITGGGGGTGTTGGGTGITGGGGTGMGGGATGRGAGGGMTGGGMTGTGTGILGSGQTGGAGGGGSGVPAQSNFLRSYFTNPYVTSLGAVDTGEAQRTSQIQSQVRNTRGAFGSPTFGSTTTRGGTATTQRGNLTGGAGRTGQNTANNTDSFNAGTTGAQSQRMPTYAAAVRFPVSTRPAGEIQTELSGLIAGAETVPSRTKIKIQVVDQMVTLSGEVSDEEEKRHVEALVRLTPGVGPISNQLVIKP